MTDRGSRSSGSERLARMTVGHPEGLPGALRGTTLACGSRREPLMRASILIGLIVFAAANTASAQNPTPQRAGERYKSVRVLTEAPASQMIEMMSVIAGSLGVTCAHCHETDFASDAKPMKDTAREMIRLTATTDAAFGGRGVITCNTCHQGHATPPAVAGVEQAGWMRAPAAAPPAKPLPTADQVFAKYVAAVGGAAAIDKVSSRTVAGTVTRDNGRTGPMSGTFTLTQTLPGSAQIETVFSFPPEPKASSTRNSSGRVARETLPRDRRWQGSASSARGRR